MAVPQFIFRSSLTIAVTCYIDNQLAAGRLVIRFEGYSPTMTEATIALFGISVALLTPFHGDGRLNLPLFCQHAKHALENGPNGVTLFGTTGEGASIGLDERQSHLNKFDAAELAKHAVTQGFCGDTGTIGKVKSGSFHCVCRFFYRRSGAPLPG